MKFFLRILVIVLGIAYVASDKVIVVGKICQHRVVRCRLRLTLMLLPRKFLNFPQNTFF